MCIQCNAYVIKCKLLQNGYIFLEVANILSSETAFDPAIWSLKYLIFAFMRPLGITSDL
jgi:hypothetical protein